MKLRLHKEGKTIIPVSFLILAAIVAAAYYFLRQPPVIYIAHLLAVGGIVMFGLVLNFFRNPDIQAEENVQNILAPCDGKVVVIEEIQDKEYFNGPVIQVSIFMSPLNVHVNRNPIGGTVKYVKYHPGKFLVAFNPKSSTLNERTYVVTENDNVAIGYKQIAGYVARRIKCYLKENDVVSQGAEYGFIKFGSRIDLLIPTNSDISVSLGDKVKSGRSVIAQVVK